MSQTETVVYKVSRFKTLALLVCFLPMAVAGYFIVAGGVMSGWWLVGLGVVGTLLPIVMLIPGSTYIRLAPDGLTISRLYRKVFIPWADIQEFDTAYFSRFNFGVIYRLVESKRSAGAADKMARSVIAYDGAIQSLYAINYKTLCAVLQQYLEEYRKTAEPSATPTAAEIVISRTASKKNILIVCGVLILIMIGVSYPWFVHVYKEVLRGFDDAFKTEYKKAFIKSCVGSSTVAEIPDFCDCLSDAALASPLGKKKLMKNEKEVYDYLETHDVDRCREVAHAKVEAKGQTPDAPIPFMDPAVQAALKERNKMYENPTQYKALQEIEKAAATAPAATPKAAPAPAPVKSFIQEETEPSASGYSIHLANGQTLSCSNIQREKGGVWAEVEGGKVFFSNAEIKKIVAADA